MLSGGQEKLMDRTGRDLCDYRKQQLPSFLASAHFFLWASEPRVARHSDLSRGFVKQDFNIKYSDFYMWITDNSKLSELIILTLDMTMGLQCASLISAFLYN